MERGSRWAKYFELLPGSPSSRAVIHSSRQGVGTPFKEASPTHTVVRAVVARGKTEKNSFSVSYHSKTPEIWKGSLSVFYWESSKWQPELQRLSRLNMVHLQETYSSASDQGLWPSVRESMLILVLRKIAWWLTQNSREHAIQVILRQIPEIMKRNSAILTPVENDVKKPSWLFSIDIGLRSNFQHLLEFNTTHRHLFLIYLLTSTPLPIYPVPLEILEVANEALMQKACGKKNDTAEVNHRLDLNQRCYRTF